MGSFIKFQGQEGWGGGGVGVFELKIQRYGGTSNWNSKGMGGF